MLAVAHEVLFLDPLVAPPRAWLRWPVSRETLQLWQRVNVVMPALEGWVGGLGYGAAIDTQLHEIGLRDDGVLMHSIRSALATQTELLRSMSVATSVDETVLLAYLRSRISEEAVRAVILALARAYMRDPGQPLREEDTLRVQRARDWVFSLTKKGFTISDVQEIPFVGPYAAFASYCEMLFALLHTTSS